jgi:hypothetical protein
MAIETSQGTRKESISNHHELADLPDTASIKDLTPGQLTYAQGFAAQDQPWRDAFEKRLLRKVDFRLLPLLVLMYLLSETPVLETTYVMLLTWR